MNELTDIHNKFLEYGAYIKKIQRFSTEEIKKYMEPIIDDYFSHRTMVDSPKILIIHSGGVGDFILFSPCLREIHRIYSDAFITLMVTNKSYNIAALCPYVDKVVVCDFLNNVGGEQEFLYDECIKYMQEQFSNIIFDIVFNYGTTFSSTLISYMSGARGRFLFLTRYDWQILHKNIPYEAAQDLHTVVPPYKQISSHMVDKYLSVLDSMLHYPLKNRELEVWYSITDEKYVERIVPFPIRGKAIALCMGGTGDGIKSYPPDKYAELLSKIISDEDAIVVIVGGLEECKYSEYITARLPADKVLDFSGRLNFRQTTALLSKCDCYIGNDTSCMHIAAALKLPVLTVFSYAASLPLKGLSLLEKYYPYHVPCVILQPDEPLMGCRDDDSLFHELFGCSAMKPHCITQVGVEEMYEGYHALINEINDSGVT